ncbi:class I SAM-dependent methyltransferase [Rathayibacter festucae]|uniref:class I SAM-dependent methyltransferase n=1 Tax=Rathayibacter festucae TaxID=110937 RepID=UPI0039C93858
MDSSVKLLSRVSAAYAVKIEADCTALPFVARSFDRVVSTMTSTDFSDWGRAAREMSRVLSRDGELVLVVAHPCFAGISAHRNSEGAVLVDGEYSDLSYKDPRVFDRGIRAQVGARGMTLTALMQPFLGAGLRLACLSEGVSDNGGPPHLLGLRFLASE